MSMTSFYGGPAGRDFSISKIFTTRYGASDSLQSDILLGWTSPVGVGEFVVVAYGLPGDPNYETLRDIDLNVDARSYNFTLWLKCYDEDQGEYNGLYYELIGSLTGNTPRIKITYEVVSANVPPSATISLANPDAPVLTFKLPRAQILSVIQPSIKLEPDQEPSVEYSESNIDKPTLQFSLPVSQVIKEARIEQVLTVGETPEVSLDSTVDGTVRNPVLKFKLPASQELLPDNIKTAVEDADYQPKVVMDNQNKNNPTLTFHLPQAQILQQPQLTVVDSTTEPSLAYDDGDINSPLITFSLPRAPKFFFGDELETQEGGTIELEGAEVGDFYINQHSGNVHKATSKDGNQVTFEFVACVQAPLPSVSASGISPYSGTLGEPVQPEVSGTYNEGLSTWSLEFKLPKAPTASLTHTYVASGTEGEATVKVKDENGLVFDFQIPKGTRVFAGQEVYEGNESAVVAGAEENDLYINSETGIVYTYGSGNWAKYGGSLKGPIGNALNIVHKKTYTQSDIDEDTLEKVSKKLEEDLYLDGSKPKVEDIIAVTYQEEDGNETSYWYFYTEDSWGRVQLTGGLADVIEKTYKEGTIENKVYSVGYVNGLIGQESEDKDHTTYSKTQIEEMLSWNDISTLITE